MKKAKQIISALVMLAMVVTFSSCEKVNDVISENDVVQTGSSWADGHPSIIPKTSLKSVGDKWDGGVELFDGTMSPVANTQDASYDATDTYDSGTGCVKDVDTGDDPNAYVLINSEDVLPDGLVLSWKSKTSADAIFGCYVNMHRAGESVINVNSYEYYTITDTDWHECEVQMIEEIEVALDNHSIEWSDVDYFSVNYIIVNETSGETGRFDGISYEYDLQDTPTPTISDIPDDEIFILKFGYTATANVGIGVYDDTEWILPQGATNISYGTNNESVSFRVGPGYHTVMARSKDDGYDWSGYDSEDFTIEYNQE